ncbi:MAG: alkaline phosphatase D family protein [Cyanobacteriota bacterium]|nr:alkaline phosphatase D family protein [Cyanobacteriota bacterium]
MEQQVVKYEDTFYLKHEKGQYLIPAESGRHDWPKLGNTGKAKLQIIGGKGEVTSNSYIKIRTTESSTGKNDVLGAFGDSHNCYYWRDEYDNGKQGWRITKASGTPGPIYYGDRVFITNISYSNQRLAPDTKYQNYVTTVENAGEAWILEPGTAIVAAASSPAQGSQPTDSKSLKVFHCSVASGDPTSSSVIIWTRINPDEYQENIPLTYQVSLSGNFESDDVQTGTVKASDFGEKTDYTVQVDLDQNNIKLESDQTYYYKFIYGDNIESPVGRCRTLPATNDTREKLRLAVLTCNDYSTGYFNAFYHLAEEPDLDFVIHLGDFAYEYPQYPPGYGDIIRHDLSLEDNPYPHKSPDNCDRAISLQHFRQIYQTYRQDPALQKAMENHTWIITLDDHEIADNCYWDYQNNTMDVSADEPLHPIYEHLGRNSPDAMEAMRELFINATQAWREYVPARVQPVDQPDDPRFKLYRSYHFGSLMDFFLTDSRSFRDRPNLEVNEQILEKAKNYLEAHPNAKISDAMKEARKELSFKDWKASMLGPEQKEWLLGGLEDSETTWRVWGNQTFLATALANEMMGEIDDWHGFKAERYEILQSVKGIEKRKHEDADDQSHFVVFTGDMHTSLIAYLKTDTESLSSQLATGPVSNFVSGGVNIGKGVASAATLDVSGAVENVGEGLSSLGEGILNVGKEIGSGILNPIETVQDVYEKGKNNLNFDYTKLTGVELMTPSVTSPGISEGILKKIESKSPVNIPETIEKLLPFTDNSIDEQHSWQHKLVTGSLIKSLSPHIEHFDSRVNGYAIAEFTQTVLKWSVYRVNKTVYDKLDDGRNISTLRAEKELVQSVTYNPDGISLENESW